MCLAIRNSSLLEWEQVEMSWGCFSPEILEPVFSAWSFCMGQESLPEQKETLVMMDILQLPAHSQQSLHMRNDENTSGRHHGVRMEASPHPH